MILALFAVLTAAQAAGADAPPVRAHADLNGIFQEAGYPVEAMMRGEVGSVGFAVAVARDGSVAGCRITASSGSRALDEGTCRIVTERARFRPARNAAGEAVADEVQSRITWALPAEPTGARARTTLAAYVQDTDYPRESLRRREQGRVEFELDISPEGRVVNCRVIRSTAGRRLNFRTCQIMLVRARFTPARDAAGNPTSDTVRSFLNWIIPES